MIKDRIICGVSDSGLRERLLRVADLDLEKNIFRSAEQLKCQRSRTRRLEHRQQEYLCRQLTRRRRASRNSHKSSKLNTFEEVITMLFKNFIYNQQWWVFYIYKYINPSDENLVVKLILILRSVHYIVIMNHFLVIWKMQCRKSLS